MRKPTGIVARRIALELRIVLLRGQKVILDADLAALYGVTTRRLNEQVRRNRDRFPLDFAFQITAGEKRQVVAICDHLARLKFAKSLPLAFTEHGAIMAASVLNSPKAVEASVFVVRAFVRLREVLVAHRALALKLEELETKIGAHDAELKTIVEVLRQLMGSCTKKKPIGFGARERKARYNLSAEEPCPTS